MKKKNRLVLFDIDGTLLRPGTPFRIFEHVCQTVYGIEDVHIDWKRHTGSVDRKILFDLLTENGISKDTINERLDDAFNAMHDHFVRQITKEFKTWKIDDASALVQKLDTKVHLGIMTGRYEKIAWEIVRQLDLHTYFSFGVFGNEADDRSAMARLVPERIKQKLKESIAPHDVIVIGDTPHDVTCARAIGAKVITVSTGRYSFEELRQTPADLQVTTLSDVRVLPFILT